MMRVKRIRSIGPHPDERDIETRTNEFFEKQSLRKEDIVNISLVQDNYPGNAPFDFYIFYDDGE